MHYYMVYIAYFTELNSKTWDYAQKRRICRENCKYALDERFHCHFCPRRKPAKSCHPGIWLNKLFSLTLELCGLHFYLFLFPSIFISIFFMFFRFRFLFSFLSIFIADAAFLYLWAKLADWRDHPDDIYTLKLKIKIHKPYIPKNVYMPKI